MTDTVGDGSAADTSLPTVGGRAVPPVPAPADTTTSSEPLPEDQAAVFDRYFHTTTSSKHDSTGLGLTIAQELAHLHHGEILLESEVGKGSCFTLKLPLLSA